MKKISFISLFISFLFTAGAQTIKNANLIIGKVDSIHSKILNENRQVWIFLPASANNVIYARQHYPVLYLLDAEDHFMSVTAMIQQLSEVNGNTVIPEMIVVGITNTDRTRDLTPTNSLIGFNGKTNPELKTSGSGEKFAAFIEKELMPHIDSLYAPSPYKVIIGHSLGGLEVMNILVHHPNLFNAYVAIDPSMWWDSRKLLNETKTVLTQKRFEGRSLFLAIANTMPWGMDTMKARKDTSAATIHIRSILTLNEAIRSNAANGLTFAYKYYNEDNHESVPLIAAYDALHFLFNGFGFTADELAKFFDLTVKVDAATLISDHYQRISKQMGYKVLPPQPLIGLIGRSLLVKNMPEQAYSVFSLYLRSYPDSFNANDSLGDYYKSKGDKQKAIEYYSKALAILENSDTRAKLKQLQENN
ncbi:alpha/beta hydrolase-fold protein [Mucilaginibacter sp.]|uniref:alpha/beta hydrolase-fold protein n=1 Tax=Mucilaginibacter sp. TaxID=1882438 RepID=UPI0026096991|nr:alpha/beta hydrolase-fold protein [Mucilaginibacter sp.]MDB4926718.1 alpha/beta hydrolase [Mucilaginibacter sp.]